MTDGSWPRTVCQGLGRPNRPFEIVAESPSGHTGTSTSSRPTSHLGSRPLFALSKSFETKEKNLLRWKYNKCGDISVFDSHSRRSTQTQVFKMLLNWNESKPPAAGCRQTCSLSLKRLHRFESSCSCFSFRLFSAGISP